VVRVDPALARVAADIGSGTGIFTRGLLERGFSVQAVEPNADMRRAAEEALAADTGFTSRDGRAEATGLAGHSGSLIVAAQAFHWFDRAACRVEWQRILRPSGVVGLVWNRRRLGSDFMNAYEAALTQGSREYSRVMSDQEDETNIRAFFGAAGCER